ncbi:phytoene desaturase family protein [Bacillus suaedae]|uniref:Phytoene desaturase n=1 Tax=Halalkalibacter suaedae TaxID=2822140 RepID=A0A940WYS8_9BACI|nr:phytoene desaturase family protein [Bacillus suaedae]MBP3951105.1 phytoene desaturase [Bacillus suaedae]
MKNIAIIGAGLGGLASAILLAYEGFNVEVYEKNQHVGGKMMRVNLGEAKFDFGPNTITMPHVFQNIIERTGANPDDYFQFIQLDSHTRNHFPNGESLDLSTDTQSMKKQLLQMDPYAAKNYDAYLEEVSRLFKLSNKYFLPKTFTSWKDYLSPSLAAALFRVRPLESLDHFHRRYFKNNSLIQMMNRYATYIGSSPYLAPATFAMISYLELVEGVYYVKGGNPAIAEGFFKRAKELGVTFHLGSEINSIDVQNKHAKTIISKDGKTKEVDLVIMNGDLLRSYPTLIKKEHRKHLSDKRLDSYEPSISAFVILASLKKRLPGLIHHQVFFSESYQNEFNDLFNKKVYSNDPTIYICNSSYTDQSISPQGDNLFILINAPSGTNTTEKELNNYKNRIYQLLADKGYDIRPYLIEDRIISPQNISDQFYAYKGALYGPSSNNLRDSFLRPPNQSRDVNNLYFVGGSTHPGGGSPMVTLSGMNVADLIVQRIKKRPRQ